MSTWVVGHGMVPLLVPAVFPPVDFSMQAHVFFGDTWHHPYISTCFCGKRFYFPCPLYVMVHMIRICTTVYTTIDFTPKSVHSELVQQLVDNNTSLEEDNARLRRERSDLSGRLSTMEREVCVCAGIGVCA